MINNELAFALLPVLATAQGYLHPRNAAEPGMAIHERTYDPLRELHARDIELDQIHARNAANYQRQRSSVSGFPDYPALGRRASGDEFDLWRAWSETS